MERLQEVPEATVRTVVNVQAGPTAVHQKDKMWEVWSKFGHDSGDGCGGANKETD